MDSTPKSIQIKVGDAQTLKFYNAPVGGLELIKVSESNKSQRIPNTTFELDPAIFVRHILAVVGPQHFTVGLSDQEGHPLQRRGGAGNVLCKGR